MSCRLDKTENDSIDPGPMRLGELNRRENGSRCVGQCGERKEHWVRYQRTGR